MEADAKVWMGIEPIPAVWLRANRRVFWKLMYSFAFSFALFGAVMAYLAHIGSWNWFQSFAVALPMTALLLLGPMWMYARSRIKFRKRHLLIDSYLPWRWPYYSVPINVIESFFVHETPFTVPGPLPTRTLVIRLDPRATEWAAMNLSRGAGITWRDCQILIDERRCQQLDLALVARLNTWLTFAKATEASP